MLFLRPLTAFAYPVFAPPPAHRPSGVRCYSVEYFSSFWFDRFSSNFAFHNTDWQTMSSLPCRWSMYARIFLASGHGAGRTTNVGFVNSFPKMILSGQLTCFSFFCFFVFCFLVRFLSFDLLLFTFSFRNWATSPVVCFPCFFRLTPFVRMGIVLGVHLVCAPSMLAFLLEKMSMGLNVRFLKLVWFFWEPSIWFCGLSSHDALCHIAERRTKRSDGYLFHNETFAYWLVLFCYFLGDRFAIVFDLRIRIMAYSGIAKGLIDGRKVGIVWHSLLHVHWWNDSS